HHSRARCREPRAGRPPRPERGRRQERTGGMTMSSSRPERSLIFDVCVDAIFRTALLFSVFLLFTGHNAPGGGFVGGLVVGAARALRYRDSAVESGRASCPSSAQTVLGVGITDAGAPAAAGWLGGGEGREGAKGDVDVPVIGTLHGT